MRSSSPAFVATAPRTLISSSSSTSASASSSLSSTANRLSFSVASHVSSSSAPLTQGAPRLLLDMPASHAASVPLGPAPAPAARPSRVLHLFESDLRVADNASLRAAASASASSPSGALIPVVLRSNRGTALRSLATQIDALGSSLLTLPDARAVADACSRLKLHAVYMNWPADARGARVVSAIKQALQGSAVELVLHWGGALLQSPTASHFNTKKSQSQSQSNQKQNKMTIMSLRNDILKQGVRQTTTLLDTPHSLPALPAEAASLRTLTDDNVSSKGSGASVNATADAIKLMHRVFDKSSETLRLSKTADAAVTLKKYLDCGALSLRMVAKHAAQQLGGQLKGRTFSELVWRNYVSLTANAHLVQSVKNGAAMTA